MLVEAPEVAFHFRTLTDLGRSLQQPLMALHQRTIVRLDDVQAARTRHEMSLAA